ncbi:MAG: DUF308 domain-containing protein [Bacteroidales bacterium]
MNFYFSAFNFKSALIRSIIAIIVGLIFCIFPENAANTLIIVVGAAIILMGLVSFLSHFTYKNAPKPTAIIFINLIISLIAGVLLIVYSPTFVSVAMIFFGILLIIGSLGQIITLISLKRLEVEISFWVYISPILLLLVGLLICFDPFHSASTLFIIFGIAAIFYGV